MDRLREGARRLGLELDEGQLRLFQTYFEELIDWNRRMNLTRITNYDDVQVKHFLDSLTLDLVLKKLGIHTDIRAIDVGTGAGFPGIPLKILIPEMRLTLLESTGKKALFLEHICAILSLSGVDVVAARAEETAHSEDHRERYDLAFSRAVAALPALVELTLPFCKIGGIFVAQKQAEAKEEIETASRAAGLLGGRLKNVLDVSLPELAGRCLITYQKYSPTPPKYPRRSGMPAKQPLV